MVFRGCTEDAWGAWLQMEEDAGPCRWVGGLESGPEQGCSGQRSNLKAPQQPCPAGCAARMDSGLSLRTGPATP